MENIAFIHTEPKFVAGPATLFKNMQDFFDLDFFVYDGLERGLSSNLWSFDYTLLDNNRFWILDNYDTILISPLHSLVQYKQPGLEYIKPLLEYCIREHKLVKLITHYTFHWWTEEEKKEFRDLIKSYNGFELWSLSSSFTKNFKENICDIPVKEFYYTMLPLFNYQTTYCPHKMNNSVTIITRATDNRAYKHITELVKNKDYFWRIFISCPEEQGKTLHSLTDLPLQDNVELYLNVNDRFLINRALQNSEFCLVGCYYDNHYSIDEINAPDNTVVEAILNKCEVVSTKEYDKFFEYIGIESKLRTYETNATAEEIMGVIRSEPYRLEQRYFSKELNRIMKGDKRFNPF